MRNLLKWKGVKLDTDMENACRGSIESFSAVSNYEFEEDTRTERESLVSLNRSDPWEIWKFSFGHFHSQQTISVELNKGWNSRLGFSLQNYPSNNKTFISAIYSDCVAAKDGRLKVGDQILMVSSRALYRYFSGNLCSFRLKQIKLIRC